MSSSVPVYVTVEVKEVRHIVIHATTLTEAIEEVSNWEGIVSVIDASYDDPMELQ